MYRAAEAVLTQPLEQRFCGKVNAWAVSFPRLSLSLPPSTSCACSLVLRLRTDLLTDLFIVCLLICLLSVWLYIYIYIYIHIHTCFIFHLKNNILLVPARYFGMVSSAFSSQYRMCSRAIECVLLVPARYFGMVSSAFSLHYCKVDSARHAGMCLALSLSLSLSLADS